MGLQSGPVEDAGRLPDDLSSYIGKKTLVKLILEAIEDLEPWTCLGEGPAQGEAGLPPAMMLTLLAFCYATGIFSSEDIQLAIEDDQMVRYLCAGDYPDLGAIRSFRRYNRDRLNRCLEAVLQRVWELRFCGEDAVPIRGGARAGSAILRRLRLIPAPDFSAEAARRILRAVRADCMAMDD